MSKSIDQKLKKFACQIIKQAIAEFDPNPADLQKIIRNIDELAQDIKTAIFFSLLRITAPKDADSDKLNDVGLEKLMLPSPDPFVTA